MTMARRASGEYGCSRSTSSNFLAASSNLPLLCRASASANILLGGSGLSARAASPAPAQPPRATTTASSAKPFRACSTLEPLLTFPTCGIRLLSLDDQGPREPQRPLTPSTSPAPDKSRRCAPAPPLRLGDDYGCYRTAGSGFSVTRGRPKRAQKLQRGHEGRAHERFVGWPPVYSPAAMAKPMSTGLASRTRGAWAMVQASLSASSACSTSELRRWPPFTER